MRDNVFLLWLRVVIMFAMFPVLYAVVYLFHADWATDLLDQLLDVEPMDLTKQ